MDTNEINDRVQRGAALLDAKRPGWADRIDLDDLDMSNVLRCVLGQTEGNYSAGLEALALGDQTCTCCREEDENAPTAQSYGFNAHADGEKHYSDLTAAWRQLVTARRSEHQQALADYGWLVSRDSLSMISPGTGAVAPIEPTHVCACDCGRARSSEG